MKLQPFQIYALARSVGLPESRAVIATAIAMAESNGGETTAHNDVPPDNSYGLWQINMIGAMGPARRAAFGIKSNDELFDPFVNAKAMAQVSGLGVNFLPWTTYTRGTYRDFLTDAQAASAQGGDWQAVAAALRKGQPPPKFGQPEPGTPAAAIKGAFDAGGSVDKAASWLSTPHNWWRIAGVIAGALLIFIAVFSLIAPEVASVGKAVGKLPV